MRLFFCILASGILGGGIVLAQLFTGPKLSLQLLGNTAFVAGICLSVVFSKVHLLGHPGSVVFAIALYLASTVALGVAGLFVFDRSETLGTALMGLMALGYTPGAGPDAPFFERLPLWLLSLVILIAIGIGSGAALRARLNPHRSVD